MKRQLVLFVGGGSIGHIAPSVAVAHALRELRPHVTLHFIVSERPEDREFVVESGLTASSFDAPRLSWNFPWKFWEALRCAHSILREMKPHVIFSKGGAVSVPMCLAAKQLRIPIVLHESDAVSGWANWLVGRWAERICLGFKGSIQSPKAVFTGTPVRRAITAGSRQRGLAITGLSHLRPVLLILGGSQGALALNRAVVSNLTSLLNLCDVIHLTGKGKALVAQNPPGYWQCPFVMEEYPHLLAAADVALSRAGATTIVELAATGLPTILVPLEGVAHDHQRRNAEVAIRSGGCILLEQRRLTSALVPTIRHLLGSPETRHTMSSAIHALHQPEAARQIAGVIAGYLA